MSAALSPHERNAELLRQFSQEMLAERRLIIASNRGPVEYAVAPEGRLEGQRGSGGVVTALSAVCAYVTLTWIASAMTEGDRLAAAQAHGQRLRSPIAGQNLFLRFVTLSQLTYHKYYDVFCNPLLWFLQHYMWNSPFTPNVTSTTYDAWDNGYVPANEAFAATLIEEARNDTLSPFIMLHDYHLYLAPGMVRRALPNVIMEQFIHIPWPTARYWQLLPAFMRRSICENLCACDIVGLQTVRDLRSFLDSCESFLPEAEVDHQGARVWYQGRLTQVNAYPISIDVAELKRLSGSARVQEYEERLKTRCAEKTIVRVDRLEPSKNIVRGFQAYELLLARYPEFRGQVTLLAFLVPSRTSLHQYQRYTEAVRALVESINARFGTASWQPVHAFYENNYPQAIAGMRLYDVLLVNPVIDGMNLVSKEGPVVNTQGGVVILSETAGSFEQLRDYVLGVSPGDVEGTVQALHAALTMPEEARRSRAANLRRCIEEEDITMWLYRQFNDLAALA